MAKSRGPVSRGTRSEILKVLIPNGCGWPSRRATRLAGGARRQRGVSVVIDTEAASIASLMCMVPSWMPAFIAARTASGWVLSS